MESAKCARHAAGFGCAVALVGACASGVFAQSRDATIEVASATYGANCGARHGNATADLAQHCDRRRVCAYEIDKAVFDDAKAMCSKDFVSEWRCGDSEFHMAAVSAGFTSGSTLMLTCVPSRGAGK